MATIVTRSGKGSSLTNDEVDANFNNLNAGKVEKTSDTGAALVPAGTTAQRDGTPAGGYFRFNSTTDHIEFYDSAAWQSVAKLSGDTFTGTVIAPKFQGAVDGATILKGINSSGVTLVAGTVVSLHSGSTLGSPKFDRADCTIAAKMPAVGFVNATSTNGAECIVTTSGTHIGLDTSTMTVNDPIFVHAVAGQVTTTHPTLEVSQIQRIGYVLSVDSDGEVEVGMTGRAEDLPNLNNGNFFFGAGGVATRVSFATKYTEALALNSIGGLSDVALTTPAAGQYLSWDSAEQEFVNGVLAIPADGVGEDELFNKTTLIIKNSSGTALKTIFGVGITS